MLTPEQIQELAKEIDEIYRKLEFDILKNIATKMRSIDLLEWNVKKLIELDAFRDDTMATIIKTNALSEKTIKKIITKAVEESQKQEFVGYHLAGKEPISFRKSKAQMRILEATLKKTNALAKNLAMSTAATSAETFIKVTDLAYMKTVTGAFSMTQAVDQAINQAVSEGVRAVDYKSGYVSKIDVAIKRAVRTGAVQTTQKISEQNIKETGVDYVEISAHGGARDSHAEWQGRVIKYEDLAFITDYGEPDGLGGYNCRHSFYPFFMGISEPKYSEPVPETFVNYNGESIGLYKAEQTLRGYERKVREFKTKEALGSSPNASLKVKEYESKIKDITSQTGIPRQRANEKIY